MTARELIEELKKMPPNAEVSHIWDGAARTTIEHVWLANSGEVVTADRLEVVYDDEDRPVGAPKSVDQPYWKTPR